MATISAPQPAATHSHFYSTAELAGAVGVTPRTVRFYETRGLLKPERAGTVRVFTYVDRARLLLILRGKRLGFRLTEIGNYLELYGSDSEHIEQLGYVVSKSRERIAELEGKLQDLQVTIKELRHIEHEAVTRIKVKRGRTSTPARKFTTVPGETHQGRTKP
jgi:DNA-binding transcriptional MerR regulator